MKKIMGIPIVMLVIGLVVLGGASAALVKYLSNTITMTTDIGSPLEMTGDVSIAPNVYGGGYIKYKVTTKNLADAEVWSFAMTEVTAPTGQKFLGSEFTEILLKDNNYPDGIIVTSMMKYVRPDNTLAPFTSISQDNLNVAKIIFDNGATFDSSKGYVRSIGFNEYNDISIKTHVAIAPGTYSIKSCQVYSLDQGC